MAKQNVRKGCDGKRIRQDKAADQMKLPVQLWNAATKKWELVDLKKGG